MESYFYENEQSRFRVSAQDCFDFPPHLHHQAELCVVTEGEQEITVGGVTRTLGAGEAALVLPNVVHAYRSLGAGRLIIAIFDPSLAGAYMDQLVRCGCAQPFVEKAHPDVTLALMRLTDEKGIGEGLASAYVSVAVGWIMASLTLYEKSTKGEADTLRSVLEDINGHLEEKLTLDILAGRLFMNRYSISRLFSERMGCRLNDYINTLRADRAHNLLRDSSLPLSEIIRRSGFESERTFYRVFREKYGCSPKKYLMSLHDSKA